MSDVPIPVATRRRTAAGEVKVNVDKNPDECPVCLSGVEPINPSVSRLADDISPARLERLFQCPRKVCQRLFIAQYFRSAAPTGIYLFRRCTPVEMKSVAVSETVTTISKNFSDIFTQAHKAEQLELVLVAGPGYRKALEFLIKDYLIIRHPSETETIKKMPLASCISTYAEDAKVKAMASRAAWLGNDETHYVRLWADKDLQDLKKLINLTVHWIEMEELTKEVVNDMQSGKN